jgi:hypothetical protein
MVKDVLQDFAASVLQVIIFVDNHILLLDIWKCSTM